LAREDDMATHVAAAGNVKAHCPLCGDSILSVNSRGRIISEDMHAVPLYTHGRHGEGYMVCDGCGFLAQLPGTLTVN
jgi:predicted RNA-binding Zn-ribbon protein involved in translation (DUF1610 family)